jgi:hypothetical protein
MIPATSPTIVSAIPAKTYDGVWIKNIRVISSNPNMPVRVIIELQKCYQDPDTGVYELSPIDQSVQLNISDLYFAASEDPELADIVNGLTSKAISLAKSQGKI